MKGVDHNNQVKGDGDLDNNADTKGSGDQTRPINNDENNWIPYEHRSGDLIADRFEVHDVLGRGSFGVVYLVYDRDDKEAAALKTYRTEHLGNYLMQQAFREEVRLWIELERHPYLLAARWVEVACGRTYVKMDYIAPDEHGRVTLRDYLIKPLNKLTPKLQLVWGIQICLGMEHANRNGVRAHCDIKPSNILISSDKSVRITDFGLAVASYTLEDGSVVHGNEGLVGTTGYIAPELYAGAEADCRSDIFSFGIILWQMAMGTANLLTPVERGDTFISYHLKLRDHVSTFTLSPDQTILAAVIMKCLKVDPNDRYQNFSALRVDLEALLESHFHEKIVMPVKKEVDAQTLVEKASGYSAIKDYKNALKYNTEAIQLVPNYGIAWNNRAVELFHLNRLDEALEAIDHALTLLPNSCKALLNKAVFLRCLDRFDEAHQLYDQILKLDSHYAKAWANKGLLYRYQDQHELAKKFLTKAVEIDQFDPLNWACLGSTHRRLGDDMAAIQCYTRALALNPQDHQAHNGLGVVFFKQQRLTEAAEQFNLAMKLNQQNPEIIRANLARTLAKLKDYSGATAQITTAIKIAPDNAWIQFCQAEILFEQGDVYSALRVNTKAAENGNDLPEIWFLEGCIKEKLQANDSAIEAFRHFLKIALPCHNYLAKIAEEKIAALTK